MEVEKFRGYVAALTAMLAVVGGAIGAVYVWQRAIGIDPPPETTAIFGVFTGLIGIGGTYLFMQDAASRASHASERANAAGAAAGAALPDQAPSFGAATTGETLDPLAGAQSGVSEPAPGPLEDGEAPPTP